LLPILTPLDDIPAVAVTGTDAARLRRGLPVLLRESFPSDGATVCAMAMGRPVALASIAQGLMRPTRVFNLPFPGAPDVDHA
jgi:tRNA pseudouridine55 synthase